MNVVVDRMQESDLDEVMRIEKVSFRFPWKRSFFETDLNRPTSHLVAARQTGRLIGYAVVWHVADELHLANIAADPEFRHQGVGTQLLREVLALGRDLACTHVFLEVRAGNTIAQDFYLKYGFVHAYTRQRYYPDGEDAFVFELDFARLPP